MKNQQLEIGFSASNQVSRFCRSSRRRSRAKWWFTQMRMAVDAAPEPRGGSIPAPEQTYLTLVQ